MTNRVRGPLSIIVSTLLLTGTSYAQAPAPAKPAVTAPGPSVRGPLKIIVLVGEGAVHRIPLRLVTDPVVEIRDSYDFPVEGASVEFTLPAAGPSGMFGNQATYKTRSDSNGQAGAFGFNPNQLPGKFSIQVTASVGDRTATAVIHQSNSLEAIPSTVDQPKSRKKRWLLISGLAAGALVATLLATRSGSAPPPAPPTVVLRPGTISVGGPR